MHRPLIIAGLVLLLAVVPLSAQHGGGHGAAGGHGGMASHSGFSGGHAFSAPHSATGAVHSYSGPASRPSFSSPSFSRPSFSRPSVSARGFSRPGGVRIRSYGMNNCYGYGCRAGYGYPWGYLGGYDPYWWWDSSSSYDQSQDQQYQTGLANEMNAQSINEQRMRQQADQDLYADSAPPPLRERSEHEELNEAAPATVLVFRDEHKQEVHNYAIVGQTLWNFNPQHTQKIPLSDLDIPETTKENDAHGVDFHVPSANESQ
jgi:hypothetical protein